MVSKNERRKRRLENQKAASEQVESNRKQRDKLFKTNRVSRSRRNKTIGFVSLAIVILLVIFGIYSSQKPGNWDDFAKCLTEKGAVMYGEDWCQYTNGQKQMFGKSFKYINYEVKEDLNLRPTWVIDGQEYERVQSFERLAELTGCEY